MTGTADAVPNPMASPAAALNSQPLAGRHVVVYGMNYAPEIAGVGKYTGEIAEHFAKMGARVTAITTPPHYPGWAIQQGYRNCYSSSVEAGVQVFRCPLLLHRRMRGIWRLLAPLTFAFTSAPIALWLILVRRPHTVFLVEPTLFAAPVAILATKLIGARVVLHVQDLEVDAAFAVGHLGSRTWLLRVGATFERACLRHLHSVITISNGMAEKLAEKGVALDRLSVVRNWVDLETVYPPNKPSSYRAELGYDRGDFVVLYAGSVGAKQDLSVLVDAARLLKDHPHIKVVIAGEGPAKPNLLARASDLHNVRFLGFQPKDRLQDFLAMADLHALIQATGAADLVLPSKVGGMLSSGKRVLVTAELGTDLANFVAGAAEIVRPGDADALSKAICKLATTPDDPTRAQMASKQAALLSKTDGLALMVAKIAADGDSLPLEEAASV